MERGLLQPWLENSPMATGTFLRLQGSLGCFHLPSLSPGLFRQDGSCQGHCRAGTGFTQGDPGKGLSSSISELRPEEPRWVSGPL